MKVNLINYEMSFTSGILTKFALRMSEELDKLGIKNVITDKPDPKYDINHHIIYIQYHHVPSVNTVMVTHLNSEEKFRILARALGTADMGICMSQQMVDELIAKDFPKEKLMYILPAHDGELPPIPVAILTNTYPDGVKRESMLNELAKVIDPSRFIFRIMGKGWDIDKLKQLGLQVEYYPEFDRDVQRNILINSKYYLYFALDQGSMALLDAMNAGVRTIAPLDGYHNHSGVDLPFTTQEELNAIFKNLQKPPLREWTWEHYTKNHLSLWEKLLKNKA
jgi:hypothetical protein